MSGQIGLLRRILSDAVDATDPALKQNPWTKVVRGELQLVVHVSYMSLVLGNSQVKEAAQLKIFKNLLPDSRSKRHLPSNRPQTRD